ncbi:MAG TPA: flagellar assembly protein FliW, partial [Bacillales bacterium]|nr:flagellar assembly protein FliW [Bacillales bacterium]
MNIETKYHGTVEINDNQIIDFTSGLPGFLQEKRFVLLPFSGNSPFFILQSVATASLAFVVTDPFSFYQDYDFTLPDAS